MSRWKYRLYQFMQGRRGIDEFGRFLLTTAFVLLILCMFFRGNNIMYMVLYYGGLAILIYGYFRAFSRNIYKRDMENQRFLAQKYRITKGKTFRQWKTERKMYAYFKCPGCGQKMRAPKGKGSIKVTCHSCNTSFQKKV